MSTPMNTIKKPWFKQSGEQSWRDPSHSTSLNFEFITEHKISIVKDTLHTFQQKKTKKYTLHTTHSSANKYLIQYKCWIGYYWWNVFLWCPATKLRKVWGEDVIFKGNVNGHRYELLLVIPTSYKLFYNIFIICWCDQFFISFYLDLLLILFFHLPIITHHINNL